MLHRSVQSAAFLIVSAAIVVLCAGNDANYIPSIASSCVQLYGGLPSSGLRLVPLPEFVECLRTTAIDVAMAYNITKYAHIAYELHSPRGFMPASVGQRFRDISAALFDTSGAQPVFTAAAAGLSELDFHVLLANAFNAGTDYHFGYYMDNFLGSSFFSRPFVFGSRFNTSTQQQEVYVKGLSVSLSYWRQWFHVDQSSVAAVPSDVAPGFDLNEMSDALSAAAQKKLTIVRINGMDPVGQYFTQLWRTASNMADDHAAFNDLLNRNLNPSILSIPPQYFVGSTSRRWVPTSPDLRAFASLLYTRNLSLPMMTERNRYFEDYELSDGSVVRVPLLIDMRNSAEPSSDCVVDTARGVPTKAAAVPPSNQGRPRVQFLPAEPISSSPIAMRRIEQRGEELYRHLLDMNNVGNVEEQEEVGTAIRERQRRRSDPYAYSTDETLPMAVRRVYSSSIASAYYLHATPAVESVMYLRLYSFYASSFSHAYQSLAGAFNALLDAGSNDRAENFVIDVRGNGGGYVFLTKFLLGILDYSTFQSDFTSISVVDGRYQTSRDVRVPTPNNVFVNSSMMLYTLNLSAKIAFGNAERANPSVSTQEYNTIIGPKFYLAELNGTANKTLYPNNLTYLDDTISQTWLYNVMGASGVDYDVPLFSTPFYFSRPVTFDATWGGWANITLVTDGQCGSACCMFETRLSEHLPRDRFQFRQVGFGGLAAGSTTGSTMQSSQFCGGSVLSMYCTPDGLRGANISTTPYLFPGRYELYESGSTAFYPLDMRFNEWHWLSNPDTNVPRQFIDHPVEAQVLEWDVTMEDVVRVVYGGKVSLSVSSASQLSAVTIALFVNVIVCAAFLY